MKVALAQINVVIGDFEGNARTILQNIEDARAAGAELVVFPELSICGYPPQDFLEFSDFTERCAQTVQRIADACTGIAAIVGAPTVNPEIEGKNLFNSALLLHEGKIAGAAHKALLPTYDIFDEYRYFEPARHFACLEFKGCKIALSVCEDIWDIEDDLMYTVSPMRVLAAEKPDIAINISASPFSYDHLEKREKVVRYWSRALQVPLVYVNYAGAQTELIFDGNSMLADAQGNICLRARAFAGDLVIADTNMLPALSYTPQSKTERIYEALVCGIRDYFGKMGFRKAILGLSGGIDSAVTAVLAADALGGANVQGLLMPSQYSSNHSVDDAVKLARNLGMPYETLPIRPIYESFENSLQPIFKGLDADVTEENLQSRIRGTLLMALSNKFNSILLNTSNKSENAVGYGTLYGDMNGGLSVLGDVYKTEVYELARFLNRHEERIPENSIIKPPSAELRPGQKDTDSLPEYDLLDRVLYLYIECRLGPAQIIAEGFDEKLVLRILRMVNKVEFKRKQTAPVLRISSKAFGHGRRMPIVGKYLA